MKEDRIKASYIYTEVPKKYGSYWYLMVAIILCSLSNTPKKGKQSIIKLKKTA